MTTQAPASPPKADPAREHRPKPADGKPKRLPPYQVIILNDDEHTFPYVISLIQKVFHHDANHAVRLTANIHHRGRAVVWTGPKEHAEMKRDLVRGYGPDFYASAPVRYPLGVRIEPMPDA